MCPETETALSLAKDHQAQDKPGQAEDLPLGTLKTEHRIDDKLETK